MRYLIVLIMFSLSIDAFASSAIGTITAINGTASIDRNQQVIPIKIGTKVETTDTIRTHSNTLLQIIFIDKTAITLGANTLFSVQSYQFGNTANSKAEFSLVQGFYKAVSGKIGKLAPQRFKIKTKNATIGIRGTTYSIQVNDDKVILKTFKGETYLMDNLSGVLYPVVKNKQLVFNNITKEVKISALKTPNIGTNGQAPKNGTTPSKLIENNDDNRSASPVENQTSEATTEETNGSTVETSPDTSVDTTPDAAADTSPDTAVDTTPDAAVDTSPDTAVDTTPDVAVDTSPEPLVTPVIDSTVDEVGGFLGNVLDTTIDGTYSNLDSLTKVTSGSDSYTSYGYWLNPINGAISDLWTEASSITTPANVDALISANATAQYNGNIIAIDENNHLGTGSVTIDVNFNGGGTAIDGNLNYNIDHTRWNTDFVGGLSNTGLNITNFIPQADSDVTGITGQLDGQFSGPNAEGISGAFNLQGTNVVTDTTVNSSGVYSGAQ
ncbi:hypothetical protein JCM30760_15790 [Thiomicrorhabdus hydrogeniphila]